MVNLLRGCLHHGPRSCPMSYGFFSWSHFHGSIPEKCIFRSPWVPLTRCKPNVNQEEWPHIQKWMCWFFLFMSKRAVLGFFFSCLTFSPFFFPYFILIIIMFAPKYRYIYIYKQPFSIMVPLHLQQENLLCLSYHKFR